MCLYFVHPCYVCVIFSMFKFILFFVQDRMRGVVASIRQNLKKANFHNFENILQAFQHYDKVRTTQKSNFYCVNTKY